MGFEKYSCTFFVLKIKCVSNVPPSFRPFFFFFFLAGAVWDRRISGPLRRGLRALRLTRSPDPRGSDHSTRFGSENATADPTSSLFQDCSFSLLMSVGSWKFSTHCHAVPPNSIPSQMHVLKAARLRRTTRSAPWEASWRPTEIACPARSSRRESRWDSGSILRGGFGWNTCRCKAMRKRRRR